MQTFYIPAGISNIVLLATCLLSAYQHTRMKYTNTIKNIQFVMIAFSLLMILVVTLYNSESHWLSVAFFVIAVVCFGFMIRQRRMLPPMGSF